MDHLLPSQANNGLKLRPLVAALLTSFSAFTPQLSLAVDPPSPQSASTPDTAALPDLGAAPQKNSLSVNPGPSGITLESRFDSQKIVLAPQYSNETGASLGVTLASMLGEQAAVGVLLNVGADKKEWLINAGYKMDERQRFVVTAGQLKQFLDYAFLSGTEKVGMTQNSGAVSYQLQLGTEFLRFLEVNGYVAKTASRDLSDKTFAVNTATLFSLWNDPRRIAGGQVTGMQGKLGFSPIEGSLVKVSLGGERLSYDLLAGKDSTNRLTGGFEWVQQLPGHLNLKLSADSFASQNRYSIGLDQNLNGVDGGRHTLGVSVNSIRGRDGLGNDTQFKLLYSYAFGTGNRGAGGHAKAAPAMAQNQIAAGSTSVFSSGGSLLDQVAQRPSVIPSHVVAKIDTTALPTRLIAVDKTALPTGSSINAATGDITTPLGVIVTGIAGVTRNGGAFANNGQFILSGNSALITRPSLIVQPPASVIDTYVVTFNNQGGGTTLANVVVSHGSVKIDSITITAGASVDSTAPVTTAPLGVSGTTHISTRLSVTINENGTGYYLVQPAANPAPTIAAVQAGTAFAMSANTAATLAISGLTASTAYTIYFVAKDTANNVQGAMQSVALTTTAAPDVIAPVTTAAPTISVAATATTATVTQTINETGTGYYLMLPAANPAPTVAAVMAGTPFAMTAGVAASVSLTGLTANTPYKYYFVAKDAAATPNVQTAVSTGLAITTTAAADTTPPVTTAAPAISVAATATTVTVTQTINENGTGYYLMLPAASAPPSVAAVLAGTPFAMTAGVTTPVSLTGLTANTPYKYYFVAKDAAATPNVQTAVSTGLAITTTAAADTTPPVTTAAPAISVAATATTVTVTQTINENGTGYYLMLPAASAPPSVAAVLAGTPFAMTAGVTTPVSLTGLTANTPYKYYFVAKDAAATPNVQTAVSTGLAITTTAAADTTPPVTTAAPTISVAATATTATVTQTINETGTGYYLMLPAANPAPTVAAVMAGTPFAMTANTPAVVSITGLTAGTAYKYYFVAKDAANNDQAAISAGLSINTTISAPNQPTITAGYPSATNANSVAVEVNGEIGASVWVNGTNTGSVIAANGKVSVNLDTSGADGVKNFSIVLKNADNNPSTAATLSITADRTPAFLSALDLLSSTHNSASISYSLTEAGTMYYVVVPNGSPVPNAATVRSSGTPVAVAAAETPATLSITGLSPSTHYDVYLAAKDTLGNAHAYSRGSVGFNTTAAPDTTPPSTPTTLTLTGNAGATTGYTNTQSIAEAVANVTDPSGVMWFVSESSSAPVAGAAGWSSTKPTSFTLSAGDGVKSVYVYVKDNASPTNNVQPVGKVANITLDSSLPTITGLPNWGAGVASGSTTATSVTFGDTALGSPQAISITADNGASITGFTGAYGARSFNFVAPVGPATVTITYSVTDNAGNVTTTTQNVSVAAAVDTTPPAPPTGLSLDGGVATTGNTVVSLGGLTTPPDADLAGWFVSESSSAPAAGAAGWSNTKPTTYTFATATNETKQVCVYVKDASNNVQPTGACDTIDKVP